MKVVGFLFRIGPTLFGIGFLAPAIEQFLRPHVSALPFGITPLAGGLAVGGLLGGVATLRKRWI